MGELRIPGTLLALCLALQGTKAAAQQPTPTPGLPVFAAEANIVHVDAVVTDRKGNQITDLTAADFEIESKGKRFPATIATYIPLVDDDLGSGPARPRGVKLRKDEVRRVMAFLVARPVIETEGGNSPESTVTNMGSSNRLGHIAGSRGIDHMLERFLKTGLKPHDLVAFVNVDSRKPLLSQFTADPDVLAMTAAAFRRDLLNPGTPPLVLMPSSPDYAEEPLVRYCLYTIGLAREVVERLKVLPGRKMLFVMSGVLRITGQSYAVVGLQARDLVESANRAGVTIYGINPSGLATPRSEALGYLAAETGGSTIERTQFPANDLGKIMELNRGYYLLGYDPGEASSTLPRRIKVHLKREGLKVAARPMAYSNAARAAQVVEDAKRPAIETLFNTPLADSGIRVRMTPYVRWTGAKVGEFLAVVDIDPKGLDLGPDPSTPMVNLEVVARLADQRGKILKASRADFTKPVKTGAGANALQFVFHVPLPSPGIYQADVALEDKRNGQRGSATAMASLADPAKGKKALMASSLVMTSVEPFGANPQQTFRSGSEMALTCVVANARRAAGGREAQIEIRLRILKDGRPVLEPASEVLRQNLPELINVNGRISLAPLAAGDYLAEVTITDLLGEKGRNAVTMTAPFSLAEPGPER